jgi:hypothetical protein
MTALLRFAAILFGVVALASVPALAQKPAVTKAARSVVVNAVKLPDQQVADLERQYRFRILDGRYWYDAVSGAWGMEGGPAAGLIHPGLKLGGKLRADASGGGKGTLTGVFINGRELHPQDVAGLSQIVYPILPGRYWVDAQGNAGFENGPAQWNLAYLAQQAAAARGGGKSWMYRNEITGIGAGGSGGCVYVMGSGSGSGGSWSASSGC